jgi:hypothetical protein
MRAFEEARMTEHVVHPLLPHAAPADPDLRLMLYGIRRMAAGGIGDAHAAHAFLARCGMRYRRPLVLLRALVAEVARTGAARLAIGPCCCPRMSSSEAELLAAIGLSGTRPVEGHFRFARLLKVERCPSVADHAAALAACFADFGRPLAITDAACV